MESPCLQRSSVWIVDEDGGGGDGVVSWEGDDVDKE